MENRLYAGAAMRKISPNQELLEKINSDGKYSYKGVGDDTFVRVTVLSNGERHMVFIAADNSVFPMTTELPKRLEELYGIKNEDILCGGTRSHQTVTVRCGDTYDTLKPGERAFTEFLHEKVIEAVGEAIENLVPARIGAAVGESHINVSREYPSPIGTLESQNHNAPAAPWLRVVCVETMKNEIISVMVNYSMHCCLLCWNDTIGDYKYTSGDVAGAVSEYVEKWGRHKFPCSWFVGGGTDREPTIYSLMEHCAVDDSGEFYFEREVIPIEGTRMLLRQYAAEQGLDVIRTINSITDWSESFDGFSAVTERSVPARIPFWRQMPKPADDNVPRYLNGSDMTPVADSNSVKMKFRLVSVGGIFFAGINCSPYAYNYRAMSDRMPVPVTMLFDDCFGNETSIPTPECEAEVIYGHSTMQSRCFTAEHGTKAFIDGFDELAGRYKAWAAEQLK